MCGLGDRKKPEQRCNAQIYKGPSVEGRRAELTFKLH